MEQAVIFFRFPESLSFFPIHETWPGIQVVLNFISTFKKKKNKIDKTDLKCLCSFVLVFSKYNQIEYYIHNSLVA